MKLSNQPFHARVCHRAVMLTSLMGRDLGGGISYGPGPALAYSLDAAKDNDEKVPELTCVLLFCDQPTLLSSLLNHELRPVGIPGFLLCALFRA